MMSEIHKNYNSQQRYFLCINIRSNANNLGMIRKLYSKLRKSTRLMNSVFAGNQSIYCQSAF